MTRPTPLPSIGIDPGSKKSAFVSVEPNMRIGFFGYADNGEVLSEINHMHGHMAIEDVTPRAQRFGHTLCDLTFWCGAFYGRAQHQELVTYLVQEGKIRSWLCGKTQGVRDTHVRTAVFEMYGGKKAAIGTQFEPGPLYKLLKKSHPRDRVHLVSALAIALWAKHSQKVGFHPEGVTRVST